MQLRAPGIRRVLLELPLLALFACSESSPQPRSEEPSELVLTKPDGTTVTLAPSAAECSPSEYDPDVQVVRVQRFSDKYNLDVQVVPSDVKGGKSFELPIDSGAEDTGPANASFFVGSKDFEVSTAQEDSKGTLEVVRASCDPVALELNIDASLDSEYFDGDSLKVKGHLDLTG